LDTVHTTYKFEEPLVENSGTGMDELKTFNVSSAAAIVASANGIRIGRHGARALTSVCGTVDLLEAVGLDVECDISTVEESIKQAKIGLFNGMSPFIHPKALFRILSQIRFGSTLNIAASLANPCRPVYAVRGVYSRDIIPGVCAVMKEIGYKRAMVLHGFDSNKERGMDELSVLGESSICEIFPDGSEHKFSITPEDVGLERRRYEEIAPAGGLEQEALRFIQVLGGRGFQACIDFTCLNAAAILYIAGHTDTIRKGIALSYETIATGKAVNKLNEWIAVQNKSGNSGPSRFEKLLSASNIRLK
jgi:anthranilate phosphoribosyltransferase